jgi:hypothetical protein
MKLGGYKKMARPMGSKNMKWDKEQLYDLYHKQGLDSNQIGEKLGATGSAVRLAMYKLGVQTRTISEATSGERHYAWKGGITKTSTGYLESYMPKHHMANSRGRVKVHVLEWEKVHNRKLRKGEVIHHLNGIKTDNRPENLSAMKTKEHNQWIPKLQTRIRELEKQLQRCSQEVFELGI